MKTLTMFPEWAFAIAHLGKRVENRGWRPPLSLVGQRLAIHAGAHIGGRKGRVATDEGVRAVEHMCPDLRLECNWWPPDPPSFRLDRDGPYHPVVTSAVVATCTVAGLVDDRPELRKGSRGSPVPWGVPDQVWWILSDVQVLEKPIPCKGRQGLWEFRPDEHCRCLLADGHAPDTTNCPVHPHLWAP